MCEVLPRPAANRLVNRDPREMDDDKFRRAKVRMRAEILFTIIIFLLH